MTHERVAFWVASEITRSRLRRPSPLRVAAAWERYVSNSSAHVGRAARSMRGLGVGIFRRDGGHGVMSTGWLICYAARQFRSVRVGAHRRNRYELRGKLSGFVNNIGNV